MTDDMINWLNSGGKSEKRAKFFSTWKKNGSVRVWYHTESLPPATIYRHPFPGVRTWKDRETGRINKFLTYDGFVCHQSAAWHRSKWKNGGKVPDSCPLCKMLQYVEAKVKEGKIKWTDAIFEFPSFSEKQAAKTIHAGGIYGGYGSLKTPLTEAQKADLHAHRISPAKAWSENAHAQKVFLFCVVADDDVDSGVQIAIEKGSLEEKIRKCVQHARSVDGLGPEKGDPRVHPYPMKWIFDKDSKDPKNFYDVIEVRNYTLTPAIDALIHGPMPDVSRYTEPCNKDDLREVLEEYAVGPARDFPWNEIFAVTKSESFNDEASESKQIEMDVISCEDCQAPMKLTDTVCANCGAKYDVGDSVQSALNGGGGTSAIDNSMGLDPEDDIPFIQNMTFVRGDEG